MADTPRSIKGAVRKAALRLTGYVTIQEGERVGFRSPEEERAALERSGFRLRPTGDTNPVSRFAMLMMTGEPDAPTPELLQWYLATSVEELRQAGLLLAEPGDPDGFLVKWRSRAKLRETMAQAEESPAA